MQRASFVRPFCVSSWASLFLRHLRSQLLKRTSLDLLAISLEGSLRYCAPEMKSYQLSESRSHPVCKSHATSGTATRKAGTRALL